MLARGKHAVLRRMSQWGGSLKAELRLVSKSEMVFQHTIWDQCFEILAPFEEQLAVPLCSEPPASTGSLLREAIDFPPAWKPRLIWKACKTDYQHSDGIGRTFYQNSILFLEVKESFLFSNIAGLYKALSYFTNTVQAQIEEFFLTHLRVNF